MGRKLFTETVEPEMPVLVRKLMADGRLDDFNLVGGTALALQLGHRKSVEITSNGLPFIEPCNYKLTPCPVRL
jgi:hypothetical protein